MGLLLAALLGGFFGVNAMATPEKAGQIMTEALQKRFPGAKIDAKVEGKSGRDVLRGRFRSVRLDMADLGAVDGVPLGMPGKAKKLGWVGHFELFLRNFTFDKTAVESAELKAEQIAYDFDALKDKKQLQIVHCGPATAKVTVAADALEALLVERFPDIREADLTMQDGQIRLSGKKALPLIRLGVPFHLTCRIEIRNSNEIWVTDERVAFEKVTGFSLPVGKLFERMNPVYAFDKEKQWPFEVKLTNLTTKEDKMNIEAALTFVKNDANPQAATEPTDDDKATP